jgi:type II secretory pathway pseudopilin PulG
MKRLNQRGYTIVEMLVAMGMLMTVMALVYVGVRPQVQHAGNLTRMARMQGETRGAFDLIARDMRMAGYGLDLTMPGVPAPAVYGSDMTFWGNFGNVKTTGSGAGSTVTVANGAGFQPNNYLVITSTVFGGEAKPIAGVSGNTVILASPLSRAYAAGSAVRQLEPVRYQTNGQQVLLRNSQAALTGVSSATIHYYLKDGSLVTTPPSDPANMRTALVSLVAVPSDAPAGSTPDDLNVSAEVRIRNLGLVNPIR